MPVSRTIVISCAGTGARLGFGHTKALLKIAGKPLIIHHLEQLKKFDDIRIVVGFGAQDLINTVLAYRKDITFVFNHRYLNTSTLRSLYLGARFAREYVVSIDGDLMIAPADLKKFLNQKGEVLGYIKSYTDNPVYITLKERGKKEYVTGFQRNPPTKYEWTGLVQIKSDKIINTGTYVYHNVSGRLPFPAMYINCREIDTPDDLKRAIDWSKKFFR